MIANVEYQQFTSGRTFGVELEVNRNLEKSRLGEIVREADSARQVKVTAGEEGWEQSEDNDFWHVKFDRSCGWEVASYKANGVADIDKVGKVAEALDRSGAQADYSCGLHVHADIADFTVAEAGVLYAYWLKVEDMVAQSCPSRRRMNKHCQFLRRKKIIDSATRYDPEDLYHCLEPQSTAIHDNNEKKVSLNLVGYALGRRRPEYSRKTAELRLPEGSLLRDDVTNWAVFHLLFVERCRALPMPEDLYYADLGETLCVLGLEGKNSFFLLDNRLRELKIWFLRRLVRYGTGVRAMSPSWTSRTIQTDAALRLEKMGEFWGNPGDFTSVSA